MKTTDLLTFFQPTESTGSSWTFPLRKGDVLVAQFWVFTWGDEDLSRFANSTASTQEEFDALFNDLRGVIQQRGGVVVYAVDYNNVVRVQLYRVATQGYAPPESLLRLRPFGDALPEKITGDIDLDLGDHLLLPVSKDAEARLNALREDLKGLPSDLESSILNVIRRPSLEWRVERIEQTLGKAPAPRAEKLRGRVSKGTWWEKIRGLGLRPIPVWTAAAVALLLTAGTLGTLDAYERFVAKHGSRSTESSAAAEKSPPIDPGPSDPNDRESAAESPIQAGDTPPALNDLFTALKDSKSKVLHNLYTSHFQDHQETPFEGKSPVVWGIAKLEALRLGLIPENDPVLETVERQSGVKAIYSSTKGKKALTEKDSLNLLAWTSCQQFGKAELPSTSSAPTAPWPFNIGNSCKDSKSDIAVPGLEALTQWVKEHKK